MLIITHQITKTDLLKEMAKSLANSENSLHIEVENLPNFLNTPVAFRIFNYQISNFPKPVFWLSYDNSVVRFLHNCHASFPPHFLEAQQPLLTTKNPEFSSEYLSLIDTSLESLELNYENENEQNTQNLETLAKLTQLEIAELENAEKLNLEHKNHKLVENFDELNNQIGQKVSDFNSKKNSTFINFHNYNNNQNHLQNSSQNLSKTSIQNNPKKFSLDIENDFNREFAELQKNNQTNFQNGQKENQYSHSQNLNYNLQNSSLNQFSQKSTQNNPQNTDNFSHFSTNSSHNYQNNNQRSGQTNRKKIDFNFPISEQIKNISEFESLSAKNLFRNNYNQSSLIGDDNLSKLTKKSQKPKFTWNFKNFFGQNKTGKNWQKPTKIADKLTNNSNDNLTNNLDDKRFNQNIPKQNLQKNQEINQNTTGNTFQKQNEPNQSNQKPNSNNSDNLRNKFRNSFFDFKSNIQPKEYSNNINTQNFEENISTSNHNSRNNPNQVKTKKYRKINEKPFFVQNLPPNLSNKITPNKIQNKINFEQDIFNFNQKNQFANLWNKFLTKKNTLIAAITSFSFAVIIFFFFLSFFPTQAYTLQISPIGGKNKTEFELNLQQFETQTLKIQTTEKTGTTGKQKTELPKSIGKFQLINRGNSPIYLTNGGFSASVENKRYFHKFNPNLPGTITIPAFNESAKMEIELEAEIKGDNYNLMPNVALNITNLKGEGVCDNCFAKTLEEIKNSKINPQNIVSEDDKKKLIEMTDKGINEKIKTEIDKISQDNPSILTNKDWYKIIDKNSEFSAEIGKPVNELISTNSFNVTVWSLKKDQIIKLIKEQDDKVFTVSDLSLENSVGSIEQKTFKITVNYNYLQYENLSRDEIIQELEQKPMEEVQKQLQVKYLGLQNIQKEEKGVKIPGINPRINLNIIKSNSENSQNNQKDLQNSSQNSSNISQKNS